VLDRAELPVDTVQLARFLIGKMLVRTPATLRLKSTSMTSRPQS
jgi:3-methyladenine DNA glycosylase Mpg